MELVLSKLAQNPDWRELLAHYPRLSEVDIQACLSFAAQTVRDGYLDSTHAPKDDSEVP